MPLLFRELFSEKNKKDRCGGTQERKIDARKQRKSGKQLLTLLTPSCSSALSFGKAGLLNPAFTSASIPKQELYAPPSHPR